MKKLLFLLMIVTLFSQAVICQKSKVYEFNVKTIHFEKSTKAYNNLTGEFDYNFNELNVMDDINMLLVFDFNRMKIFVDDKAQSVYKIESRNPELAGTSYDADGDKYETVGLNCYDIKEGEDVVIMLDSYQELNYYRVIITMGNYIVWYEARLKGNTKPLSKIEYVL